MESGGSSIDGESSRRTEHKRKTMGRFGCEVRCLASSEREKRCEIVCKMSEEEVRGKEGEEQINAGLSKLIEKSFSK